MKVVQIFHSVRIVLYILCSGPKCLLLQMMGIMENIRSLWGPKHQLNRLRGLFNTFEGICQIPTILYQWFSVETSLCYIC